MRRAEFQFVVSSGCRAVALGLLLGALVACGSYHPETGPYNLGVEALDDGNGARAVAQFKRALELDPDDYRAQFNLGVAYESLGNDESAVIAYQAVIAKQPHNVPARLNLGSIKAERGDLAAAERQFREASEVDTDDPRGPSALAQLAFAANDLAAAKVSLEEALRRDPRHAASHYRLGRVHEASGDRRAAIADYLRGIDADGEDPPLLRRLGQVYLQEGDFASSIRYLELATVAAPMQRDAWAALSRAYEGGDLLEEALLAAWRARDLGVPSDAAADRRRLQALYGKLIDHLDPPKRSTPADHAHEPNSNGVDGV